jgi:hypothetical protein
MLSDGHIHRGEPSDLTAEGRRSRRTSSGHGAATTTSAITRWMTR